MRWRWVWLGSRMTACVVSAAIWLIPTCLAPAVMVGLLAAAIVSIAGWRSALVLRCRFAFRLTGPNRVGSGQFVVGASLRALDSCRQLVDVERSIVELPAAVAGSREHRRAGRGPEHLEAHDRD